MTITWNPDDKSTHIILSSQNLSVEIPRVTGYPICNVRANTGKATGKWYWEITVDSFPATFSYFGIGNQSASLNAFIGSDANGMSYSGPYGYTWFDYQNTRYGSRIEEGDVIGCAVDLDNGTIIFYNNGVSQGLAFDSVGDLGMIYPMIGAQAYDFEATANFGATPFTYVPPEGFLPYDGGEPHIITGSITFHGHASGTFGTPIKTAVGSITFHGHASMFMSAIKTAVGSITFHGASTMSLIGLVLRELEGIYQISSSEIFSRNQPVLSEDLANYIEVYINPLVPAETAEEVYKSDEDNKESIPAGETKTFTVEYSEEPVIETVASLAEAGPNLSITNTKYYGSSAEITISNTGTTAQTCAIKVTGKPLKVQGRRKIVVKDEESILDHGLVKYKFDSPLVQDEPSALDIGSKILRMFAVARANIEIEWRGDPALELADICQIPEFERLGISKKENFYVAKLESVVEGGGLAAGMAARKVPETEGE